MSSTTEDRGVRGQVIVIFALSLSTLVIIAALAFDAGMMLLERRDQQNAADAAALAGARYLVDTPAKSPTDAARTLATENGFATGAGEIVDIYVPPASGRFKGMPGFIEVVIRADRPSVFAGIMGVAGWDVTSRAVAANQQGLDLPFSMLALHETACPALKVSGGGVVESNGTIQVNSNCATQALLTSGNGTLRVTADGAVCRSAGEIVETNGEGSELDCVQEERSYAIEDPLGDLIEPPVPSFPDPVVQVGGAAKAVPAGCPGSGADAASVDEPATCRFGGSYDGTTWRLFPGYYPGGIDLGKGTYYLEPGIYYIGGGGFRAANGNVRSVEAGGTTFGGGILIFNTEAYAFSDQCAEGTAPNEACIQAVILNGGTTGVNLLPLNDGSVWDGLVIYQDRDLSVEGTDVQINGGGSTMEVAGTIYVPSGDVVVNGSSGTLILDQVIASTFVINGDTGTIQILYRSGVTAEVSGVGLVE